MTAFTHTPIPPHVPSEAPHSYQRWFRGTGGHYVMPAADAYNSYAQVFRDGKTNLAEVRLRVNHGASDFEASMKLEPAALRELAQRILDAAHDIEANPTQEGGAA